MDSLGGYPDGLEARAPRTVVSLIDRAFFESGHGEGECGWFATRSSGWILQRSGAS